MKIKGRVTDSNGEPIPYADVLLLGADDNLDEIKQHIWLVKAIENKGAK